MIEGTVTLDWPAGETWTGEVPPPPLPSLPLATEGIVIGELLGEGASATVHRGHHALLGRDVAVKRPRIEASSGARARLLREGRTMGSLEHPNVVPVHAIGVDAEGRPALVMKRLEATGWTPGELERDVEVLAACCDALVYAHLRGVVHRDLKPANVLIGAHGEVYVSDWGIAATVGEQVPPGGTPWFMGPEMFDPTVAAPTMDVYQVGACLHLALTGSPRNGGRTLEDCRGVAGTTRSPSTVDPELGALADAACAREPARRPPLTEVRARLRAWIRHRPTHRLAAVARARLADLERQAVPDPIALTECLFAFRQVVDQRPGLGEDGLAAALTLALEDAVSRDVNAEQATAWLDELGRLGGPVEALATRLHASKERQRLQAARAWDADFEVDYRSRFRTYAGWLGVFGLLVGTGAATGMLDHETHAGSLAVAVLYLCTLGGAAVLRWRFLTRNQANRVLLAALATMGGLLVGSRALAWWLAAPVPWMHAVDAALLGSTTFVLGLTYGRVTRAIGVCMLLGVPLCLLAPVGYSWLAFVAAVAVAPTAFAIAARRSPGSHLG